MSYEFSLDFGALLSGFASLINGVINGVVSALPVIAPVLVAIGIIGVLFAVIQRVPIVGDAISNIWNTLRGLF